MKILVISDSHGNVANLKHVVKFGKKIGVGAIVHAGDWNTLESIETVLSFGIPLHTVLGNADVRPEVIERLKEKSKKFGDQFLIIKLGKRKIGITHKPSDNKKYFLDKDLDLIINGHLHSKKETIINGTRVFCPGAIINGNNFAVYDTLSDKIEFINE